MYKNTDFYSLLNMEYITDADYEHGKESFQRFQNNHLGEYHDLCVQSNTLLLLLLLLLLLSLLLLIDVFENFRNMCLEIYELDPDRFLTTLGLA